MRTVADFQLNKVIYETLDKAIYQAIDTRSNEICLIKILKSEYPSLDQIASFKNDYNVLKELNSKSVVQPLNLQQFRNSYYINLKNVEGIPLNKYFSDEKVPIEKFLKIAINLTDMLTDIHDSNLVIREFSPEVIYINPQTLQLTLLDLGNLSIGTEKLISQIRNNQILLNYISPELTGRINRKIDHRSNIYSLGVLLYHMLTQSIPFKDNDPMVIIHNHIAQMPVPPVNVDPTIPLAISKIIMKCLQKIPEDRYQSTIGLKTDLQTCLLELEKNGTINPDFSPGLVDIQETFQLSEKVYGRKAELAKIREIYNKASVKNAELILVYGEPGIGKSWFINEVTQAFLKEAIVVKGKYETSKQHIPYSGIIDAYKKYVHHLLKEKEEKLAPYRNQLIATLKGNGQVMVDVIPELEFIIGKQPPLSKLNTEESRARFNRVFVEFIQVFATAEHPLILILEDLQLADMSSLNTIKDILIKKINHLLIIGTCLPHEETNDLAMVINDILKENINVEKIYLGPLQVEETAQFIADSLRTNTEKVMPLAALLHNKTNGNPFFISQLLKQLYENEYIKFNFEDKEWQWHLNEVKKLDLSANVVDLMIGKIRLFPKETQKTLSMAAAIGSKFSLELLSQVMQKDAKQTLNDLLPALQADLIQPFKANLNIQKLIAQNSNDLTQILEKKDLTFEFINDKIHEASNSLSSSEEKLQHNYQIGQHLRLEIEKPENANNDTLFFKFINHLNIAGPTITEPNEKLELARLNLEACYKAKNSTAYGLALDLVTKARNLLPKDAWEKHYDLTYAIFLESTECSFFQKKFDDIEKFSSEIMKYAKSRIDKGKLYVIKLAYYTNASQYAKVIDLGITCAELFNIKIPKNPGVQNILQKFIYVKWLIGRKSLKEVANKPAPIDEEAIFLQKLISWLVPPAFLQNKHLYAYTTLLGMQAILEDGYYPSSAVLFGFYGVLLESLFKDFKTSNEIGKFAAELCEKENIHINTCRAYFVLLILNAHWTELPPQLTEYLNKSYQNGLDSGDLFFLSYLTVFFGFADLTYLRNIEEAKVQLESHTNILHAAKNYQALQSYTLRKNFLASLSNPAFRGFSMSNDSFNEEEFHKNIMSNKQFIQAYQGYVAYKSMLFFLFGYYQEGVDIFNESSSTREAVNLFMTQKEQNFYNSLNLIGLYENAGYLERYKLSWYISKNQKVLKKWVDLLPEANSHRYKLVAAEYERVLGNFDHAFQLYDEAIKLATDNNFIGEAALGNELAAKLYLKLNRTLLAKVYMREAHYNYYRWGALSKVSHLEELYPQFIENKISSISAEKSSFNPLETTQDNFDLAAVIRASSILSKEVYLDKLLNEILRVLIVEAGADRAIFLMEQDDKWVIQGEKRGEEEAKVLQALPLESSNLLSVPLLTFVLRTKEKIIINDLSQEGMFAHDPYLKDNKVKAVMCLPVISQGKMAAILYLENKSSTDVFSPEKVRILEILSAQIASSIENSTLYTRLEQYNRNLENKVLERTNEIQQKNQELASTLEELKNTQNHLVESGKLAALGQLIAGIAHEINTPLGAVRASSQNASEGIKTILQKMPYIFETLSKDKLQVFLALIKISTEIKAKPLTSKEERKIKKEMVTIFEGKQVPHSYEIVDILIDMGIYEDLSDLLLPLGEEAIDLVSLAYNHSCILKNNQNILLAVERASKIIFALKAYIHQNNTEMMEPANLTEGMESILTLYHHQLKQNIQLEKRFHEIPLIPCRINELNQVWTNLIHNALQAMNNKGTLEIEIFPEDKWVVVQIIDSGKGIPEEAKARIFTPFFTTKSRGEGSGLGLSISKKIIDAHGGSISFESTPGRTIFSVKLPVMVLEEQTTLATSSLSTQQP